MTPDKPSPRTITVPKPDLKPHRGRKLLKVIGKKIGAVALVVITPLHAWITARRSTDPTTFDDERAVTVLQPERPSPSHPYDDRKQLALGQIAKIREQLVGDTARELVDRLREAVEELGDGARLEADLTNQSRQDSDLSRLCIEFTEVGTAAAEANLNLEDPDLSAVEALAGELRELFDCNRLGYSRGLHERLNARWEAIWRRRKLRP